MSLLDKYKNQTPAPQPRQFSVFDYQRLEDIRKKVRRQDRIYRLKQFLIVSGIWLAIAFTVQNIQDYNRSFDNCERLLGEIHQNLAVLENELQILNQSVNGVDYE